MLLFAFVVGFYIFELCFGVGFVPDACVVDFANKSLPLLVICHFYWLKD